jgi:hypothetical protein
MTGERVPLRTQDKAEYHGAFVNFGPMVSSPKPVQKHIRR